MAKKPRTELRDVFARPGKAPERNTAIEDLPRTAELTAVPLVESAAPPAAREADPAAPEPVAPEAASPEPAAPAASLPEPVAPEPVAPAASPPEPAAPEPPALTATPPAPAAPEPVAPAAAPPEPAAPEPVVPTAASPEPVAPEPISPEPIAARPVNPTATLTAPSRPPPPPPPPPKPRPRPATSPTTARAVTLLAAFAIVVALAAPFLEDTVLGLIGTVTPASRAQQAAALTLSRQEQKLRDLEQRLSAALAQLAATREDLQQSAVRRTDGTTWGAWGRLLSLGRVADALRGATPFASDLAVAQTVGAGIDEFRPDLDKLAAYSGTGVPTRADIDREFRRIADDVLRQNHGILPSGLARQLDSLNPFTPNAAKPPDPAPELVKAAAARLADGDIEEAIVRIRQVDGAYQGAFAGWLDDAQARVTADALVRRIDRTLAQLARELPK